MALAASSTGALRVSCLGERSSTAASLASPQHHHHPLRSPFLRTGEEVQSSSCSPFIRDGMELLVRRRAGPCRRNAALSSSRLAPRALFGLGVPELVVIAGVAAIIFGPKQLPEIGKTIGRTVKSFQQAAKEFESEVKRGDEETKAEMPAATKRADVEKENTQV